MKCINDIVQIVDRYSETANYGTIRLQMYNGIAKQKSTLSNPLKIINLSLMLKGNDKKKEFDKWYKNDLKGGAGPFLFRDYIDNSEHTARFVTHPLQWRLTWPSRIWTTTAVIEYRDDE